MDLVEFSNYKIFALDDNINILRLISRCLRDEGYLVYSYTDPHEALEDIENIKPDLILSDIEMPGMDGYRFYKEIHSKKVLRDVPFIFLSGFDDKKDILFGKKLGADDYITKPFTKDELVTIIESKIKRINEIKEASRSELRNFKNEIINVLNHEIRTPLTLIQGFTSLIISNDMNKNDLEKMNEYIKSGGKRLGRLIKNIDIVSNLRKSSKKSNITIKQIVTHLMKEFKGEIEKKELSVKLDINPDIPEIFLNYEQIQEVLRQIIGNAIKFNQQKGSITIKDYIKDNKLMIDIIDTGCGIDEDYKKNIFDMFYQIDRNRNEQQGLGLGLVIANNLIRENDGEILLDSQPDKGSKFTIILNHYNNRQIKVKE